MKAKLIILALLVLPSSAFAGIHEDDIRVVDDSSGTTNWILGDSATAKRVDYDTSVIYEAVYWDDLTFQVKSVPGCAPCGADGDSGAVSVVVQVSNDELFWSPIDSLVVTDSLAAFKDVAWQKWRKVRFIAHHGTKTDSTGTRLTIRANAWGRK
jgi:hypothetical protein